MKWGVNEHNEVSGSNVSPDFELFKSAGSATDIPLQHNKKVCSKDSKMKLWQSDDLIALLAWVDLCIKLEMDFDSTIEEHLNRWSKEPVSHEPFTVEQAKRKLTDTARAYRESDTLLGPSRSEILKSGSSSIPGLPVDLREEIEKATKEYERNNLGINVNPFNFNLRS